MHCIVRFDCAMPSLWTSEQGLGRDQGMTSTNQVHDALGHHAADGALAMSLASIVKSPQRNAFYTSMRSTQDALAGKPTAPPGASLTDPEANVSILQLLLLSNGLADLLLLRALVQLVLISSLPLSHSRWTRSIRRLGQQMREKFSGPKRSRRPTQILGLRRRRSCRSAGLRTEWR